MPEYFLISWYNAHLNTTLYGRVNKIQIFAQYQRKLGNASTNIGNTIVLMLIICCLFDLDDVVIGFFSEDDLLFVGKKKFIDRNRECADLFNFESKFFKYEYCYFSSKL